MEQLPAFRRKKAFLGQKQLIRLGPEMAHTQVRLRRLSYAGQVKPAPQKSRRVSYAGQSLTKAQAVQSTQQVASSEAGPSFTTMLHTAESVNMGRLDVNRNRPVRRTSRPNEENFTCSQQSVLSAMDRFVRAVNNMDATVLLPSRLQDIDCQGGKHIPDELTNSNSDLFSFYTMLKDVKNELLWGPSAATAPVLPASGRSSPRHMKHQRQSSDDSLGSTGFPSDQETDSDIESVVTDSMSMDDHTSHGSHIANAFRHHLQGMHTILSQLAESADFLTSRYQEEVDASSL